MATVKWMLHSSGLKSECSIHVKAHCLGSFSRTSIGGS
jgi:hypothetical protein